jgi:hypothetical protein
MPTAERQFVSDFPALFKMESGESAHGGKSFSKADKIVISRGGQNRLAEETVGFSKLEKSGWTK